MTLADHTWLWGTGGAAAFAWIDILRRTSQIPGTWETVLIAIVCTGLFGCVVGTRLSVPS